MKPDKRTTVANVAKRRIEISVRRVFDATPNTRACFLVDRLWLRGVTKRSLHLDGWLRDAAPSNALRRWFGHDPAKWPEFRRRYFAELDQRPEALQPLLEAVARGPVTLLFAARDLRHNNAVALAEHLRRQLRKRRTAMP